MFKLSKLDPDDKVFVNGVLMDVREVTEDSTDIELAHLAISWYALSSLIYDICAVNELEEEEKENLAQGIAVSNFDFKGCINEINRILKSYPYYYRNGNEVENDLISSK